MHTLKAPLVQQKALMFLRLEVLKIVFKIPLTTRRSVQLCKKSAAKLAEEKGMLPVAEAILADDVAAIRRAAAQFAGRHRCYS